MEDHGGLLFSLWYGVYETTARLMNFASAGHHPAYLIPQHAAIPQPLVTKGPAIGMVSSSRFVADNLRITSGSRLYLFSDGAFEITTEARQVWTLADSFPC
jgi:serine phosphatase RsbU (regulator of sigma subunit)